MNVKRGLSLSIVLAATLYIPVAAQANFFTNLFSCSPWTSSMKDQAISNYERMSTPLPRGTFRKVVPFRESDFRTKPWMSAYEIVVVVNNSSPYVHHTEVPQTHPIRQDMSLYGLSKDMDDDGEAAYAFMSQYGRDARKMYDFGSMIREKSGPRGELKPIPSNIPGAQTIRIYQHGRLIRVAKVSTGRGMFELRDKDIQCSKRPDRSYFSITEPGYFNFQELIKSGYESGEWDNASMPNAMFYKRGRGLALHEVSIPAKIATLGKRASGGCTRLDPNTASTLFDMIAVTKGSDIPVLDEHGNPVYDSRGRLQYKNRETIIYGEGTRNEQRYAAPSYSALLIIQPDPVEDANPYVDRLANFTFQQ